MKSISQIATLIVAAGATFLLVATSSSPTSLRLPPSPTANSLVQPVPAPSHLPLPSVALTFDACPRRDHLSFDSAIVRTLIDSAVPATFFISGRWARSHRGAVRLLASVPFFEVGNHSETHPHFPRLDSARMHNELTLTESILDTLAPRHRKLFRPPFGDTTAVADSIVRSLGFDVVMYDIPSGDPDPAFTRLRLVRSVVERVRSGSVVVFHVNGAGWHTAEALPDIIGAVRKRGLTFVTISTLEKEEGTTPRNILPSNRTEVR